MVTLILVALMVLLVIAILLAVAFATPVAFILIALLVMDTITMSIIFGCRKRRKEE